MHYAVLSTPLCANRPLYLQVKILLWATLKLSINGQWQIFFQQVVTYFPSTFSLSSSIAPLTLKCFINGNSLIFTPFLWNTIVTREPAIFGEAGEEKEKYRQLLISLVRIRGQNYGRSLHFGFNYFRTLLLHFTLMPCNHFFNTKVHKFIDFIN